MWKNFNINDEVFIVKESNLLGSDKVEFLNGVIKNVGTKWLTVFVENNDLKFNSKVLIQNGFIGHTFRLFSSKDEYEHLLSLKDKKADLIRKIENCSIEQLQDILNFVELYENTAE